jgi:hypothetical protein
MLSSRTALAAAALLLLAAVQAPGQGTAPHKRVDVVTQGMTPAQVRAVLGEPLRTRQDGGLTYLYYANGCARCGGDDYVVVRDCRVVGARFRNPNRFVARSGEADAAPPPAAECQVSASAPAGGAAPPAAMVMDSTRRPPPPNDAGPGGAVPVVQPVLVVPSAAETAPERPLDPLEPGAWRHRLTLRRPATHLVAVPAASITSPTAFGSQLGEAFVGVAYQQRTRFTHLSDGGVVLGAGIGDRQRAVALEVAASSYSTLRGGGPLETGGLSFKLHRAFGSSWGAAVGYENAVSWGGSDAGHSPYAVVTRVVRLQPDPARPFSALAASLGVGGGRFRTESDVRNDRKTANVFGALGLQVAEPVSVTADWSGQDLFAGVSVAPARRVPLVITAGFADLTGSAGDGARFVLATGLGFRYLPPFF